MSRPENKKLDIVKKESVIYINMCLVRNGNTKKLNWAPVWYPQYLAANRRHEAVRLKALAYRYYKGVAPKIWKPQMFKTVKIVINE